MNQCKRCGRTIYRFGTGVEPRSDWFDQDEVWYCVSFVDGRHHEPESK